MAHTIDPTVYAEVEQLDPRAATLFHAEMSRRGKSKGVALVLAILGLHYAYLRRWGLFVIYLCTAGGFLVWWVIDLFRVGGLVEDANTSEALAVLRDVRAVRG